MFKTLIILFCCAYSPLLRASEKPLSVVIIGGGPAGLATAIEAKRAGADVTVVEKRDSYSREQFVFLFEKSLQLLDQWEVSIPGVAIGCEGNERVGFTKIRDLEAGLVERTQALGIPKIKGEFITIREGNAVLTQNHQEIVLPYDVLVGADGEHSSVRKVLGIATQSWGSVSGLVAVIFKESPCIEFILPKREGTIFINKVVVPAATIISAQGDPLSKQILAQAAENQGWIEESRLIPSEENLFFENFQVSLQQSVTFSDYHQRAILLGDSAAVGSFLQGMGANAALESAEIAGKLFKIAPQECDYADFNHTMQLITDRLILDSAFLFEEYVR